MILFTGDLYLGNVNIKLGKTFKGIFNQANIVVTNFENVYELKDALKREDKDSILTFTEYSFKNFINQFSKKIIFSSGNNHINDLGLEGIIKTKDFLSKYNNVDYSGVDVISQVLIPMVIDDAEKK